MLKIAVIGGRETVMGFKALGLDTFPAENPAEAGKILRQLTRESEEEYAIIYIEENFAATEERDTILNFIRNSKRGIISRPRAPRR